MEFYDNTDEFTQGFDPSMFDNEAILLKGARPFRFERIGRILQRQLHDTVLEVNLNAMVPNLNFNKFRLAPGTHIMAMVKDFSYGSGSYEIAYMIQFNIEDYLDVASTAQGATSRQKGIKI